MGERELFPGNRDGESDDLFRPRIPLMANASCLEKCIAAAKARKVPKVAELTDLYWDGESKDCSLDHTASLAVPYFW